MLRPYTVALDYWCDVDDITKILDSIAAHPYDIKERNGRKILHLEIDPYQFLAFKERLFFMELGLKGCFISDYMYKIITC